MVERLILLLKGLILNVQQYIQQLTNTGHRSTVLMPLSWLIGTLSVATLGAFKFEAPIWVSGTLFGLLIASVLLFIVCYLYCFIKNPDLVRSEKIAITKMIIESGLIGDDTQVFTASEEVTYKLVAENSKKEDSE